jgi:hypothetical protein
VPTHVGHLVDLDQQVGNPDPAEHFVSTAAEFLRLEWDRGSQLRDHQASIPLADVGQLVVLKQAGDFLHLVIDLVAPLIEIRGTRRLDRHGHGPGLANLASSAKGSNRAGRASCSASTTLPTNVVQGKIASIA